MLSIITIILAYLIGSISCAIIICKITHLPDPRTQGSGNAGATNMLRFAGKKLALITLIGDISKGTIAVIIGRMLEQDGLMLGLIALSAFIGHLYPIFFKFKGGKGVATGIGGIFGLSPLLGIIAVATWMIIAFIFQYSSLASMVTFILTPFYALFLKNTAYFIPLIIIAMLIIWRHRNNIERLKKGTESKIGK
jgi:glycerol-3-phosphate acyltransferase PlsY